MKTFLFAFCITLSFSLFAEVKHSPFVKHDIPQKKAKPHDISTPLFKGLILVGNKKDLDPGGYQNVYGVMAYHIELPGNIVRLKKSVRSFINEPLSQETIASIKKRVTQYYQNNNRPVIVVTIPEQDISKGVLQLIITEGKVGKVYTKGNKWFDDQTLEKAIQLKAGENIASDILNQNLYWLNRNPFRHIDAIYTAGEAGTVIVVDHLCSGGGLVMTPLTSITTGHSPLRIFTAKRTLNSIEGRLNGHYLMEAPLYLSTSSEKWGMEYPSLLFSMPFTLFHKENGLIELVKGGVSQQNFTQILTNFIGPYTAELFRILHPYDAYTKRAIEFKTNYGETSETYFIRRP